MTDQAPSRFEHDAGTSTLAVVIAERGSDWMTWARKLRAHEGSAIVLAQPLGEDDDRFARRVRARIDQLVRQGTRVNRAAFVVADRTDARTPARWSTVLRALAGLLEGGGKAPRLYLDAAARAGGATHRLLSALGMALGELAKGSSLSVQVLLPGELDAMA